MEITKKETVISLLFAGQLFLQDFNLSIGFLFNVQNTQFFTIIYYIVLTTLIFSGISRQKSTSKHGIWLFFIFIIICLISFLLFPQTRPFYSSREMFIVYLVALPLFLFATDKSINIDEIIYKTRTISLVLLPWSILGLYFFGFESRINYMIYSYALLPSIMSFIYVFLRKNKFIDILYALVGLIVIMLYGSRTVFIVILVYILLTFVYFFRINKTIMLKKVLFISFVYVFIFFMFLVILTQFSDFNTRIINFILNGNIFEDQNRLTLYNILLDHLKNSGYSGQGLFADRIIISLSTNEPAYSHNIFLEIFVSFGLIGVLVTSFCLFRVIYKFLKINPVSQYQFLFLFFTFFARYLVSGSFIEELNFYLFVCLAYVVLNGRIYSRVKK